MDGALLNAERHVCGTTVLLGAPAGPSLPRVLDITCCSIQVLLRDPVLNTLKHTFGGGGMVCLVLVVTETNNTPSSLFVDITFDDAPVQWVVKRFECLPLLLIDMYIIEELIFIRAAIPSIHVEFSFWDTVIVDEWLRDALSTLRLCRVNLLEGQTQTAVNGVLLRGLPLQDVSVGAMFVGRGATGENKSVVAVFQLG
ncbi:hypothetical protein HG531_011777 [Fusarium graminearum]|nr:hypothetical protein HG531_011777 [Fusarium graminearum]